MFDDETSKRVLEQFLRLWVEPEIQRRKSDGKLPDRFSPRAAQVVMFPDGKKNLIRLNEEIRVDVKARWKRVVRIHQEDRYLEKR